MIQYYQSIIAVCTILSQNYYNITTVLLQFALSHGHSITKVLQCDYTVLAVVLNIKINIVILLKCHCSIITLCLQGYCSSIIIAQVQYYCSIIASITVSSCYYKISVVLQYTYSIDKVLTEHYYCFMTWTITAALVLDYYTNIIHILLLFSLSIMDGIIKF